MVMTRDVEASLRHAAALVNTMPEHRPAGSPEHDGLETIADLEAYLDLFPFTGTRGDPSTELARLRTLRGRVAALWAAEDDEHAVAIVNEMLRRARALPQLVRHDDYSWHIHAADDDAALWARLEVEIAMAFVDLLRDELRARAGTCAADDCEAVFIDLSRNRSKRFCDEGNCGNRANVRAYRARAAADDTMDA